MKKAVFSLFTAVFLVSCSSDHYYYLQNSQQVTLFREKDEVRIHGNLNNSDYTGGMGIQGAYAMSDKFCAAASWMNFYNSSSSQSNGITLASWNGNYWDGAFGYYRSFGKYGIFEAYAGMGTSVQDHQYSSTLTHTSVTYYPWIGNVVNTKYETVNAGSAYIKYNKYFIQPCYGIRYEHFEAAFSLRAGYLDFFKVENKIDPIYPEFREPDKLGAKPGHLFFEPALTLRAGWKIVKLQMQLALTGMGGSSYRYESYNLNFGLVCNLRFSNKLNQERAKEKPQ